jgi:hypothetical protein
MPSRNNKRPRIHRNDYDVQQPMDIDTPPDDSIQNKEDIMRSYLLQISKKSCIQTADKEHKDLFKLVATYFDKVSKLERNALANQDVLDNVVPTKSLTPKVNISLPAELQHEVPAMQALYMNCSKEVTRAMYTALKSQLTIHQEALSSFYAGLMTMVQDTVRRHYGEINQKGLIPLSEAQLNTTDSQILPIVQAKFVLLDASLNKARTTLLTKQEDARLAREVNAEMLQEPSPQDIKATIAQQVRIQVELALKGNKRTHQKQNKKPAKPAYKTKQHVNQAQPARQQGNSHSRPPHQQGRRHNNGPRPQQNNNRQPPRSTNNNRQPPRPTDNRPPNAQRQQQGQPHPRPQANANRKQSRSKSKARSHTGPRQGPRQQHNR